MNERAWWDEKSIDPAAAAAALFEVSHSMRQSGADEGEIVAEMQAVTRQFHRRAQLELGARRLRD